MPGVAGADARGCVTFAVPCTAEVCDEATDTCAACTDPDMDGDHYASTACGGDDYDPYYDDPYCNPAYYPAISVRFVDATSLRRITIGALGTISNGRVTEEMTSPEPGYAVDGRTSVLEGGFGWTGVFDVSVATRAGERYDWTAIHVTGDRCQVYTVELEAPVHFPDP